MEKPSKKHHYLPRHYLKGFTDDKGNFFVYDKQKDNIFKSSPAAAFFENNLNTITFSSGDSSSFMEGLYARIESQTWNSFNNIIKSNHNIPVSLLDKMYLFLFLIFLHWRLPSNIEYIAKLSEKSFAGNNEMDFFDLVDKNGEKAPKEYIDLIKNSSEFKKTLKIIAPFAPFYGAHWAIKLFNWRFLYTGDDQSWYIVGDNPIITRGANDHDPIHCLDEFVFPVSGKIFLVNVNKPVEGNLPPEVVLQFNTAIIERAQRFVACQNESFLKALISRFKLHESYMKTNIIIPELFKMLGV